jgi:hypothetical protein
VMPHRLQLSSASSPTRASMMGKSLTQCGTVNPCHCHTHHGVHLLCTTRRQLSRWHVTSVHPGVPALHISCLCALCAAWADTRAVVVLQVTSKYPGVYPHQALDGLWEAHGTRQPLAFRTR